MVNSKTVPVSVLAQSAYDKPHFQELRLSEHTEDISDIKHYKDHYSLRLAAACLSFMNCIHDSRDSMHHGSPCFKTERS